VNGIESFLATETQGPHRKNSSFLTTYEHGQHAWAEHGISRSQLMIIHAITVHHDKQDLREFPLYPLCLHGKF